MDFSGHSLTLAVRRRSKKLNNAVVTNQITTLTRFIGGFPMGLNLSMFAIDIRELFAFRIVVFANLNNLFSNHSLLN